MKYTLEGFSQEAALAMRTTVTENGRTKTIKLDCTDLILLRWIVDFFPCMKKTVINGTEYAWVSYDALLEDLPLLDLGKRSLSARLRKMETLGILKHETVRTKGTFAYYAFGDNYSSLISKRTSSTTSTPKEKTPSNTEKQDPWAAATNVDTTQFQQPAAEPEPASKPKKTRKAKTFDDIIDHYTDDPQTKDLLGAWLQNRKAKRAAMTDRAIQGCINKLDDCAQASRMSVNDYLNEVICRGWSAFFPIENYRRNGYQQQKPQQHNQPSWDTTPEERRQQEEEDEYFLKHCVF